VNGRPALRLGDPGIHAACCGSNTWVAKQGSATVFINGLPAHRVNDQDQHCGGVGTLQTGSPNVFTGGPPTATAEKKKEEEEEEEEEEEAGQESGEAGQASDQGGMGGLDNEPGPAVAGNPQSGFQRPVDGPITSPYGDRVHPVTGAHKFHNGMDFGAPHGAPIRAASSGKVVHSGWISGYGNTVILDHGGGVETLYAHADSLNVAVGQSVAAGERIANVGTTGLSTGPHLHFVVYENGQHVNPADYVR